MGWGVQSQRLSLSLAAIVHKGDRDSVNNNCELVQIQIQKMFAIYTAS